MKIKVFLLVIILIINVVGCSNEDTDNTIENELKNPISQEDVEKIVLSKMPNAQIINISLEEDEKDPNYYVSVDNEGLEHIFEINASTGEIDEIENISKDIKEEDIISLKDAEAIALSKVPNGQVVKTYLDDDNNIIKYDITIIDKEYKYEFEVNAIDKTIISEKKQTNLGE